MNFKYLNFWTFSFFLLNCGINIGNAFAGWSSNPLVNTVITQANNIQQSPIIVSDGNGGGIIVWYDGRNDSNWDIYAQRINSDGIVQWAQDGVIISAAAGKQYYHSVIPDGVGGAIIAWEDTRNSDAGGPNIYVQRINANGVVQWTTNGVAICTTSEFQLASDGEGGAIITWTDGRSYPNAIYAQRINSNGLIQWATDGILVSQILLTGDDRPQIISDNNGGAIIVWHHTPGSDVYAQRVNADGGFLWGPEGFSVLSEEQLPHGWYNINLISDGSGGAIILIGNEYRLHAQKINANGTLGWVEGGVLISDEAVAPVIESDGSGGAIITWQDDPNNLWVGTADIYAQRIGSNGTIQWTPNGVPICVLESLQYFPKIAADRNGGAIIVWTDYRSSGTNGYKIYAQKINGAGSVQWITNGVLISDTVTSDYWNYNPTIIDDETGGAIITWQDDRKLGTIYDTYAQRIFADGALSHDSGSDDDSDTFWLMMLPIINKGGQSAL